MKVPKNSEELLAILHGIESDEERSWILKDYAQVIPLVVLDLLLENASNEEAKNSILTTLSLFRPEVFEEYMEKNKISIPQSLEELEKMVDDFPDNRAKVVLLESVKQQKPELFEAFFEKKRNLFLH